MAVYLKGNHTICNRNKMVVLTEEMLEWDVKFRQGKEKLNSIYVKVLKALMGVDGSDVEFCLYANKVEKILSYPKKMWISIYFKGTLMIEFKSDGNYKKQTLTPIYEWAGINEEKVLEKWTINQWKIFFINLIKKEIEKRIKSTKEKIKDEENKLCNQQSMYIAIKLAINNST